MFKSIKRNLLTIASSVIALVAMTGVSTMSLFFLYEPEVPESLKK